MFKNVSRPRDKQPKRQVFFPIGGTTEYPKRQHYVNIDEVSQVFFYSNDVFSPHGVNNPKNGVFEYPKTGEEHLIDVFLRSGGWLRTREVQKVREMVESDERFVFVSRGLRTPDYMDSQRECEHFVNLATVKAFYTGRGGTFTVLTNDGKEIELKDTYLSALGISAD